MSMARTWTWIVDVRVVVWGVVVGFPATDMATASAISLVSERAGRVVVTSVETAGDGAEAVIGVENGAGRVNDWRAAHVSGSSPWKQC